MKLHVIRVVTAGAFAVAVAALPNPSYAGGGEVAAGVIGGLAVGAMIGAAASQPRPYYAPAPVYVEPAPVYAAPPPPRCYWTRGEAYWDGYRWVRPRMQVCD